MRALAIQENHYYHVYNRGNAKQVLFRDNADYTRFLYSILYLQSPVSLPQVNRRTSAFKKFGTFKVSDADLKEIISSRFVNLCAFCIMPNHFHLIVQSITDDGLARYMHKLSSAYANYFNKRYDNSGHVFQGSYKVKLINSDRQLIYTSAYIHKNPHDLSNWKGGESRYPWSSFQDYLQNRWGELICTDVIKNTFNSGDEYQAYVNESGAKEDF